MTYYFFLPNNKCLTSLFLLYVALLLNINFAFSDEEFERWPEEQKATYNIHIAELNTLYDKSISLRGKQLELSSDMSKTEHQAELKAILQEQASIEARAYAIKNELLHVYVPATLGNAMGVINSLSAYSQATKNEPGRAYPQHVTQIFERYLDAAATAGAALTFSKDVAQFAGNSGHLSEAEEGVGLESAESSVPGLKKTAHHASKQGLEAVQAIQAKNLPSIESRLREFANYFGKNLTEGSKGLGAAMFNGVLIQGPMEMATTTAGIQLGAEEVGAKGATAVTKAATSRINVSNIVQGKHLKAALTPATTAAALGATLSGVVTWTELPQKLTLAVAQLLTNEDAERRLADLKSQQKPKDALENLRHTQAILEAQEEVRKVNTALIQDGLAAVFHSAAYAAGAAPGHVPLGRLGTLAVKGNPLLGASAAMAEATVHMVEILKEHEEFGVYLHDDSKTQELHRLNEEGAAQAQSILESYKSKTRPKSSSSGQVVSRTGLPLDAPPKNGGAQVQKVLFEGKYYDYNRKEKTAQQAIDHLTDLHKIMKHSEQKAREHLHALEESNVRLTSASAKATSELVRNEERLLEAKAELHRVGEILTPMSKETKAVGEKKGKTFVIKGKRYSVPAGSDSNKIAGLVMGSGKHAQAVLEEEIQSIEKLNAAIREKTARNEEKISENCAYLKKAKNHTETPSFTPAVTTTPKDDTSGTSFFGGICGLVARYLPSSLASSSEGHHLDLQRSSENSETSSSCMRSSPSISDAVMDAAQGTDDIVNFMGQVDSISEKSKDTAETFLRATHPDGDLAPF